MDKHSVAVIGDRASALGFRALGVDTYPADTAGEAEKLLEKLAEEGCAVICLTESLAKELPGVLARRNGAMLPAVLLIPGREGSLGIGKEQITAAIRRAVGTDIL